LRPMKVERGADSFELREELEDLMWEKVGVVRNGPDLEVAVAALLELRDRAKQCGGAATAGGTVYNAKWNEAINVVNMTAVAGLIARSALVRQESRGAHYRTDFPGPDPRWLKNIRISPADDGSPVFSFTPVRFTRLAPPESRPAATEPAGAKA
jgi:succinate dehydrogenase/fumarate reductase flavoprotein subunit